MKLSHIMSACLLCLSSGQVYSHGHHDHSHDHDHDEEFQWTQEKSEYADILVEVAGPGAIQNFAQVSGRVLIHPDRLAYAISKVEGSVFEIRKTLGDTVEEGDVLAIIESPDIAEAKADYIRAGKRYKLQRALLEKETILRGISPAKDYLETELACEEAALDEEYARQHLYTLGFTEEEVQQLGLESASKRRFYAIRSPLTGKVLQRNLTKGELVGGETQAFTIASFDKIWIQIDVAQSDVQYLKEGLPVEIVGANAKQTSVKICQFDPTISQETRKATAIAVLQNPEEQWTPGEYVTAHIQTTSTPAPIVVSREAVQKMEGIDYIFVEEECGNFTPCPVKVGKKDHKNIEVISGLRAGDSYVSSNAFCLKADYQKEEVEHSH